MLKWSSKLFVGQFAPPLFQIRRALMDEKPPKGVYLVVLSEKEEELLTIYPLAEFRKSHMLEQDFYVVGVVRGQTFANRFVRDLIDEVYGATGGFDLKGWYAGSFEEDQA